MSKAEQFIKDYTMRHSNELCYEEGLGNLYEPWLTPEQALMAVEIAREEIKAEIERLIKSYSPIWSSEGKYRIEAYKEVLDIINSNYLEISRHGNSHIGENRELERIISKACDWLADNYSKYIITNGLATIFSATIDFDTIRMIEDFKKAMKT